MDRVANHRTSKLTEVYDRHGYVEEDRRIMAAVARLVLFLVGGRGTSKRDQPEVSDAPVSPGGGQGPKEGPGARPLIS